MRACVLICTFYIPVPSSSHSTTDVTTAPSDYATTTFNTTTITTTSSACKANITIDYPVNEMKKALAPHIANGAAELSKVRYNGYAR